MKWPFKTQTIPTTIPLTVPTTTNQTAISFSSETMEQIRYMLARVQQQQPLPARLAIVSALSGEGVTTVSWALATAIAHDMSARTCVVDLNWHRPFPSPLLASRQKAELFTTSPEQDMRDNLYDSGWPNLSLFHLGPIDPALRPVLARSPRLRELIDRLAQQFDTLVFDVPAILTTSDSVPLASLADAACLVIRQSVTPAPDVQMALAELRGQRVLGTILNRARFSTPAGLRSMVSGRA